MSKPRKTPKDRGQEFLTDLLALIPEDKRESVAGLLTSDERVLTFAGENVLRQEESSRLAQAVRETEANQQTWWADNQGKIAAFDKLLSEHRINSDGSPVVEENDDDDDAPEPKRRKAAAAPPAAAGLTREETQALLDNGGAKLADFSAFMSELQMRHYHFYKEPLNSTDLLAFCRERGVSVDRGGYEAFTVKLREAAQATASAEREKTIRAEERRKVHEELAAKGPGYPITGSPSAGPDMFILDEVLSPRLAKGKDAPDRAEEFSAAAAAKSYNQAVFAGGGSS